MLSKARCVLRHGAKHKGRRLSNYVIIIIIIIITTDVRHSCIYRTVLAVTQALYNCVSEGKLLCLSGNFVFSSCPNALSFCLKIARNNVSVMTVLFKSNQLPSAPSVTQFNYTNK